MSNSRLVKKSCFGLPSFALLVGLSMFLVLPVQVGALTLPGGGSGAGASPSFEATQKAALSLINAAINKLDAAENKIQNNASLSASTKTSILNDLNGIETQLLTSKTAIERATTNAELQAAYNQAIQYLKDNKDAIKNDFTLAITEIGANASAKAEAYEEQIMQLLKVLAVTCPSQASTIATLTQQITQLESDIAALNSAVRAKDAVAIKLKMNALNTLMKSMAKNVKIIQASCNIPSV